MKTTILIFTSAFILASCATKPTPDSFSTNEQELRSNISFVNLKIWGDYPKDNYSDFSEKFYYEKLLNYTNKPATQLRASLKDFDLPIFVAALDAFAICAYSPKLGIAFCDDAHCTGVEYFERAKSPAAIEKWKEELPLSSCKK